MVNLKLDKLVDRLIKDIDDCSYSHDTIKEVCHQIYKLGIEHANSALMVDNATSTTNTNIASVTW